MKTVNLKAIITMLYAYVIAVCEYIAKIVMPIIVCTRASAKNQKMVINFGIFLALLFVSLMLGNWLGAFIIPIVGVGGTLVGDVIAFVITGGTAYVLIRKFGKKSMK